MRPAGAVHEIHVDVDGLAVAASANRNLALHPVEVQRLGAFVASSPAHSLARPRRNVDLRLDPGRRDLGDLLNRSRQDTIGYQEDVATETGALVPGADLSNNPGGRDQPAAGHLADRDNNIIELQIGTVLHGDIPQQRGRIPQTLHPADRVSRLLRRYGHGRGTRFHRVEFPFRRGWLPSSMGGESAAAIAKDMRTRRHLQSRAGFAAIDTRRWYCAPWSHP